jgi:hypothetical protein
MLSVKELYERHNISLTDNLHNQPIDLLLGSDVLNLVFTSQPKIPLANGAMGLPTLFSYALQGPITARPFNPTSVTASFINSEHSMTLEDKVSAFWDLEHVPTLPSKLEEEIDTFSKSVIHDGNRYEVPLLWKDDRRPTPSRQSVLFQYEQYKSRVKKGNWDHFTQIIEEYSDFAALEDDPNGSDESGYFLPMHGNFYRS